jgi:hypothetical protein
VPAGDSLRYTYDSGDTIAHIGINHTHANLGLIDPDRFEHTGNIDSYSNPIDACSDAYRDPSNPNQDSYEYTGDTNQHACNP